ncbi:MAG TPA: hypothetical protein VGC96_06380 [Candidatus Elarobacter sp.]|jgi:hypothetical protein
MTIFATHFALVLGAWRLRVRIDLDEPKEAELRESREPAAPPAQPVAQPVSPPHAASWGRG